MSAIPPGPGKGPPPPTPQSLLEAAELLENVSDGLRVAALAMAGAALAFPPAMIQLGAAALALDALSFSLEQLAEDAEKRARELEERLRKKSRILRPSGDGNDTILDDDGRIGSPAPKNMLNRPLPRRLSPSDGVVPDDPFAFLAGHFGADLDDAADRFQTAGQASRVFADALGQVELASRAVGDALVIDDLRLGLVAEELDRASDGVGEFGDALNELEGIGADVFRGLESALERFATTGKIEWQDLARVAIQAIQDILNAQVEASRASSSLGGGVLGDIFGSVLGLFGGGTSADTSAAGGVPLDPVLNPFVGHTGGVVGGDALPRRLVDRAVFDAAARLAAGGVAGLAPDEVPAILHGGEGIFTPGQMRALGGGGGGFAPAQTVAEFQVNVFNNTGEPAKVQQRRTPGGGRRIDVVIGELAAKDVLRGGPLHRAIRLAFGVNPMTVTR